MILKAIIAVGVLVALLMTEAAPALADTANRNTTAYPLPSNVLFPARSQRLTIRCYNATTNNPGTVVYPSGFTVVLQPGGSLWETGGRTPTGQFLSTGTAGQTLDCEETY